MEIEDLGGFQTGLVDLEPAPVSNYEDRQLFARRIKLGRPIPHCQQPLFYVQARIWLKRPDRAFWWRRYTLYALPAARR